MLKFKIKDSEDLYTYQGNVTDQYLIDSLKGTTSSSTNSDCVLNFEELLGVNLLITNKDLFYHVDKKICKILSSKNDNEKYILPFLGIYDYDEISQYDIEEFEDEQPSIYVLENENNEFKIMISGKFENLIETKSVLKYEKTPIEYQELIENIKNTKINSKQLEEIRVKSRQRSSSEVLKYDILETDNSLVTMLKSYINSIEITSSEVYAHFDTQNEGWNLIYGLRNRSSITWEYFCKWVEILNCDIDLSIIPRK